MWLVTPTIAGLLVRLTLIVVPTTNSSFLTDTSAAVHVPFKALQWILDIEFFKAYRFIIYTERY